MPATVQELLDRLSDAADGERTGMKDILRTLGPASFLPVMMVPALAVLSPLSGIPGFSSVCGLSIALIAVQMLLHRDHLWLPDWMLRQTVPSGRVTSAVDWLRRPARWLDKISRERLTFLVKRPLSWITQAACLLCGLAMPFLELIPFTSSILGGAVTLMGLSLLARDGLFAFVGFFIMAIPPFAVFWFVGS
ncbi:hypothetical protein DFP88_10679 [Pseudoroseicyclus aestuarii]|uniref:Exopolysaccharide synthesis protein ExoD n=2 Tax=Pseudoroseicyclus aestuarii TaxID=1795041 RepID=A0A318SMV8_9RHOB|nr:hypothetical protein DFP88_10679 [Pseudoroseicyclus aestuarii]